MKPTTEELTGRWVDLSNRAVFRLTGPDRVRYLNGQVTNDVTRVSSEKSIPACLCSAKGKVEALIWISQEGDSLLIDGEIEQREEIFARLDRYLIADDCELTDETEKMRLIHHFDSVAGGAVSRRLASEGYDRWIAGSEADSSPLEPELAICGQEWEMLQLRSLIPKSGAEITGEEFPAELGIVAWAVSFEKGCYLGQEIISRMKSAGKLRRQLALISTEQSVRREAIVRSESEQEGTVTRDAEKKADGKFLTMAWFRPIETSPESLDSYRLVRCDVV